MNKIKHVQKVTLLECTRVCLSVRQYDCAQAIEYEVARHIELLSRGEAVQQETRFFLDSQGRTVHMRSKEDEVDYRYLPEPDLPPLVLTPVRHYHYYCLRICQPLLSASVGIERWFIDWLQEFVEDIRREMPEGLDEMRYFSLFLFLCEVCVW